MSKRLIKYTNHYNNLKNEKIWRNILVYDSQDEDNFVESYRFNLRLARYKIKSLKTVSN
jgi:hypothetical protein